MPDALTSEVFENPCLRESKRVGQEAILIKDHTRNGLLAAQRLRFMDWVGNARHGVMLPYNYWAEENWRKELENLGLCIEHWVDDLDLYPWWADWLFGSSLQFIARVHPNRSV